MRSVLLLFLFFLTAICLKAQELQFEHITPDDGLSHSAVSDIITDKQGYMWFGTRGGLNRYDGNFFVKYYHDPNDSNSVSGNWILSLYEDKEGNLWIGTDAGFSMYDRSKDIFINYLHKENDPNSFVRSRVICMLEDSHGLLWIGSLDRGVCMFDRKTKKFVFYKHNEKDPSSLQSDFIRGIREDNEGNIWIATDADGGLNLFNRESKTFTHFFHDKNDPKSLAHNSLFTMTKDRHGSIWIGTLGNGICRLNKGRDGNFFFETFKPAVNDFRRLHVLSIEADPFEDGIWIGTENGGLDYFNVKTKTFTNYHVNENDPGSLNNNSIQTIYKDKTGNLWVGTYQGGVNVVKKNKKKISCYRRIPGNPNSLSYDAVTCFFEDKEKNLWIGTDGGGLNILDRKTGKFSIFNSKNSSLHSDAILSVVSDKDGEIWVSGWEGALNRYNPHTTSFTTYTHEKDDLPNNNSYDMLVDKKGRFWISFGGYGLTLYDKKKKSFQLYSNESDNRLDSWIVNIGEDLYGNILLGHHYDHYAFSIFNPETKKFNNYFHKEDDNLSLSNDHITVVMPSHDSTLWVGTINGLNHFDQKTQQFKRYYTEDGLPDNNIAGLVEDDHDNIWISTANGISKFNPKLKTFRNYTQADGLQGKGFIKNSFYKTEEGEIVFGGTNGFNIFHPDSLRDNPTIPPVVITKFTIFNEVQKVGKQGSPLLQNISTAKKIVLSYKHSVISFEFAALDFTAPSQNQYAYFLKGFDKEWNYVGTKRSATYTNLDPGQYTFNVKASNNDGIWNEEGTSIQIIIKPPFWKTIWFKSIIALLITILLITIYYLRESAIIKKNKLLKQMVAERTQEVENKNEALKSFNLLLQERQQQIEEQSEELLAQRDELSQLNATKDKLFSILAHDLKSPFNSIIGFGDLLLKNIDKYDKEKIKLQVGYINDASRHTFELLSNLLQWSSAQRGVINFEPELFKISDCVEHELKMLRHQASRKEINIEVVTVGQEVEVKADTNMLSTIVRNLVSNAIKFSFTHTQISIMLKFTNENLIFSVIDKGQGMSEEVLAKLFKVSEHISTRGTSGEKGTGLGLILCADFVERHNGKIWVKSKLNEGSTFYFSLPIK